MSRTANKTLVGGFVVGGVALAVIAVAVFGSGRFFQKRAEYVMYFPGSIYGLNTGAPVYFRGVKVGEVKKIFMRYNGQDMSIKIPVVVELGGAELQAVNIGEDQLSGNRIAGNRKFIEELIGRGLRAQLGQQSFLTGQLMVVLDFFPDAPDERKDSLLDYPEIPTVPTKIEEISEYLKEFSLKEVTERLNGSLEGIDRLINSPDLKEGIKSLNLLLLHIDQFVGKVDQQIAPISTGFRDALSDARKMVNNLDSAMQPLGVEAESVLAEAKKTMKVAQASLKRASELASSMDTKTDGISLAQYEFTAAMQEFAAAAASFRVFIDYFERNPEMLFRGKSTAPGGQ